ETTGAAVNAAGRKPIMGTQKVGKTGRRKRRKRRTKSNTSEKIIAILLPKLDNHIEHTPRIGNFTLKQPPRERENPRHHLRNRLPSAQQPQWRQHGRKRPQRAQRKQRKPRQIQFREQTNPG